MEYDLLRPWTTLDDWQREYIQTRGNCFLLCGRQSGKSTASSIKAGELAVNNRNYTILMLAYTEKQAYNLFFKTLQYLLAVYPNTIKKGKDKPTRHVINLKNGSKIMCYAAGLTGYGLVGFTCDKVFIDEAAPMAREIFTCITPMLSVTKGSLDLLSTPRGKQGFFYEMSADAPKVQKGWTRFYINSEDCARHSQEFLASERESKSTLEYAQEYKAMFLDELRRVYSDSLIKKCCVLKRPVSIKPSDYTLGMDIARMGEDETTYEIFDCADRDNLFQVENEVSKHNLLTDVYRRACDLDFQYNFNKIFPDEGGMGIGVLDMLLNNDTTKRKAMAMCNTFRPLDNEEKRTRITNEDLFNNLLVMMEQGKVKMLDDKELMLSLASVQHIEKNNKTKYIGSYTHQAHGIVRAVYAAKTKGLRMWYP